MDVVMMLSSEAARTLREMTLSAETEHIRELVAKSGGSLEALHPDSDDPKLMRYFLFAQKMGNKRNSWLALCGHLKPSKSLRKATWRGAFLNACAFTNL